MHGKQGIGIGRSFSHLNACSVCIESTKMFNQYRSNYKQIIHPDSVLLADVKSLSFIVAYVLLRFSKKVLHVTSCKGLTHLGRITHC